MTRGRSGLHAMLLLATASLLLPGALAGPIAEGTTSTGDVDAYPFLPSLGPCLPSYFDLVATLTLLDPSPGDTVAFAVLTDGIQSEPLVFATDAEPEVSVRFQLNGCGVVPFAFVVAGLQVQGEAPYRLALDPA